MEIVNGQDCLAQIRQMVLRHGFQPCAPYYENPFEDAICMRLDL